VTHGGTPRVPWPRFRTQAARFGTRTTNRTTTSSRRFRPCPRWRGGRCLSWPPGMCGARLPRLRRCVATGRWRRRAVGSLDGGWCRRPPGPKGTGLRLRSWLKPALSGWAKRSGAVAALIWLLLTFALPLGGTARTLNAAGIVVDYGDGRVTYAYVPFAEEEISGIELLRRSGVPLVTVAFGGLGEGVCMVEETGCGVTECRRRMCQTGERSSPFWQYARQEALGEWRTFSLGASQSTVRNGDIDGWAWTGTPPRLPAITLDQVRRNAGAEASTDGVASIRTFGGEPVPTDQESAVWRGGGGGRGGGRGGGGRGLFGLA